MSEFDPNWPHGHLRTCGPHEPTKARKIGEVKRTNDAYKFVFASATVSGSEAISLVDDNGHELGTNPLYSRIINAPAPKRRLEAWVSFYPGGKHYSFYSAEGAQTRLNGEPPLKTIHVTGEEGGGL